MNILLTGDFNLHINWNSVDPMPTNETEAKFLDWMQYANLTQIVRFPTHVRGNVLGHTLDLFLCRNPAQLLSVSDTPPLSNSDHIGISSSWNFSCTRKQIISKQAILFNKDGRDSLERSVALAPWFLCTDFLTDYNPWDLFYDMFWAACRDSTHTMISSKHKKGKPWITGLIKQLSSKTRRFFKRASKTQDAPHWAAYKDLLRQLKREIRVSYRNYLCDMASQARTCPRRFWQFYGSLRRNSVATQFQIGGTCTDNAQVIANSFGQHFSDAVPAFNNSCPPPQVESPPAEKHNRTESIPMFVPSPVTTEDVAAAISQLKPGASPGPDGIPPFLLKACAAALSSPLADLYNYSFSRALIPDVWKLAHVTPVHKGTGKPLNSLESYRPISLTCILCKIFETLICSKISTHLEVNNLLCSSQHGFRKGRSCETLLSLLHHDLSSALDSSKEADVLSIDFSKAFDSVNHDHILTKLPGFGISGATLKWVSNFLGNRRQRVNFHGAFSQWHNVRVGVPQGSVIGPLLFTLYINDLAVDIQSNILRYADDHILYRIIHSSHDRQILQSDLHKICRWSEVNGLLLNPDKTVYLKISRKKKPVDVVYNAQGKRIQEVTDTKILGVWFDKTLSFRRHVDYVCKRASKLRGFITRTTREMPSHAFCTLYTALVLPVLEYCSSVWSPRQVDLQRRLESTQRKATKTALYLQDKRASKLPYERRLQSLRWSRLDKRRLFFRRVLLYRYLHGVCPIPDGYLRRSRRDPSKLEQRFARTISASTSLFVQAPTLWNHLPDAARQAPSVDEFKDLVRNHHDTYSLH